MTENMIALNLNDKIVTNVLQQVNAAQRDDARYGAYVTAYGVTHDTVKDHARAIADAWADKYGYTGDRVQTVKSDDGTKVRTKYGNAVQAAGAGLRRALGDKPNNKPTDWMRLVRQSVENAMNKGGHTEDEIRAAVAEVLAAMAGEPSDD